MATHSTGYYCIATYRRWIKPRHTKKDRDASYPCSEYNSEIRDYSCNLYNPKSKDNQITIS